MTTTKPQQTAQTASDPYLEQAKKQKEDMWRNRQIQAQTDTAIEKRDADPEQGWWDRITGGQFGEDVSNFLSSAYQQWSAEEDKGTKALKGVVHGTGEAVESSIETGVSVMDFLMPQMKFAREELAKSSLGDKVFANEEEKKKFIEGDIVDIEAVPEEELGVTGSVVSGLTEFGVPFAGALKAGKAVGVARNIQVRMGDTARAIRVQQMKKTAAETIDFGIAATVSSQMMYDRDDVSINNLFNEYPELTEAEILGPVVRGLYIPEGASDLEARFKTWAGEVLLGLPFAGLPNVIAATRAARRAPTKNPVFAKWLKENTNHFETVDLLDKARQVVYDTEPDAFRLSTSKFDERTAEVLEANRDAWDTSGILPAEPLTARDVAKLEQTSGVASIPSWERAFDKKFAHGRDITVESDAMASYIKAGEEYTQPITDDVPSAFKSLEILKSRAVQKAINDGKILGDFFEESTGFSTNPVDVRKAYQVQKKNNGIDPMYNAYFLRTALRGTTTKVQKIIKSGPVTQLNQADRTAAENIRTGSKGLAPIFASFTSQEQRVAFDAYLKASRHKYVGERKNNPIPVINGLGTLDQAKETVAAVDAQNNFFLRKKEDVRAYVKDITKYAFDSGLIDEGTLKTFQDADIYVPFLRRKEVLDIPTSRTKATKKLTAPLTGQGEGKLSSSFQAIQDWTYLVTAASDYNLLVKRAVEEAENASFITVKPKNKSVKMMDKPLDDDGLAKLKDSLEGFGFKTEGMSEAELQDVAKAIPGLQIFNRTADTPNTVSYMDNGRLVSVEVEGVRADQFIDAMNASSPFQSAEAVDKALNALRIPQYTQTLSKIIVASPHTAIKLAVQDAMQRYLGTAFKSNTSKGYMWGLTKALTDKEYVDNLHYNGMGFGSKMDEVDPLLSDSLKHLDATTGGWAKSQTKRALRTTVSPITKYLDGIRKMELGARLAEAEGARLDGIPAMGQAFFARTVSADLAMRGSSTLLRSVTRIFPFANSTLASGARTYNILTSRKGFALFAAYGVGSAALHAYNTTIPEYNAEPDHIQKSYDIWYNYDDKDAARYAESGFKEEFRPKPTSKIMIPKPFGAKAMSNIAITLLEAFKTKKLSDKQKWDILNESLTTFSPIDIYTSSTTSVPGLVASLWTNKDAWGNDIVSENMRRKHYKEREKPTTPPLAYELTNLLETFGIEVDNLISAHLIKSTLVGLAELSRTYGDAVASVQQGNLRPSKTQGRNYFAGTGDKSAAEIGSEEMYGVTVTADAFVDSLTRVFTTKDAVMGGEALNYLYEFKESAEELLASKNFPEKATDKNDLQMFINRVTRGDEADPPTALDYKLLETNTHLTEELKVIKVLQDELDAVYLNPDLSPNEKANLIDEIEQQKNQKAYDIAQQFANLPEAEEIYQKIGHFAVQLWTRSGNRITPSQGSEKPSLEDQLNRLKQKEN